MDDKVSCSKVDIYWNQDRNSPFMEDLPFMEVLLEFFRECLTRG